jgi:protein-disulfide isomerase
MKKDNKKTNTETIVIVIGSLTAFVIFSFFVFISLVYSGRYTVSDLGDGQSALNSRYYLNTDYQDSDPYMTKIPGLKDMLSGPIISDLDPSLGDKNSAVTLVIFSDFECTYCARQEKVLREVLEKHKVRLIWKDYPATDERSRSYQAALAARCAQREGAFWDYHQKLYSGLCSLDRQSFVKIADDLNLDTVDFEKCLDGALTAGLVNDNILEADALGIDGVPFLFVNDQEMLGEVTLNELESIIRVELERGN